MNNISQYITEKLHLKKGMTIYRNPFDDYKGNDIPDLLEFIVENISKKPDIWNDTGADTLRDEGFENFDTTYGVGIDWLDAAEEEVDQTALAIWMNENIDGEEIIKYLKDNSKEETIYKKQSYVYPLYTFKFKGMVIKLLYGRSSEVDKFVCISVSD